MTELTAERLSEMIIHLRTPRPIPVAIWFIDRPAMYYQIIKQALFHELRYDCRRLCFCGTPIHNLRAADAGPLLPGVWIEMSNGKHLRLQDE